MQIKTINFFQNQNLKITQYKIFLFFVCVKREIRSKCRGHENSYHFLRTIYLHA